MKLSEIIKQYRLSHDVSMESLARDSGLSKGYISMIENERNPKTGKSISPSIDTLAKLAKGIGMTLDDLVKLADDMIVNLDNDDETDLLPLVPDEMMLLRNYRTLNREGRRRAGEYVSDLADSRKYTKDTELKNA